MLFPGNSRWNPYLTLGDKSGSEMTVRRNRFASVPPGYFSSTKGHSAIRKWSNYPPSRSAVYAEDIYYPETVIRPLRSYDTTREENEIRRDVNSELMYTSNLMDDTYDVAAKSRNRDQLLLRDATRALVDTETFASPRSTAAVRRVRATSVATQRASPAPLLRAVTVPPAPLRAVTVPPTSRRSNQVVVVLSSPAFKGGSRVFTAKTAMAKREQSLPPKISPLEQLERRVSARRIINTASGPYVLPLYHPYRSIYHPYQSNYQPYNTMYRPHYVRRYIATLKDVIPDRYVHTSPLKRKKYRKAALVGNKVEVLTPHRRKPKSTYAANKLRDMRRDERDYEAEAVPYQATSALKATVVTSVRY